MDISQHQSTITTGLIDGEILIHPEVTISTFENSHFEPRTEVTIGKSSIRRGSRSKFSINSEVDRLSSGSASGVVNREVSLEASIRYGDIFNITLRLF